MKSLVQLDIPKRSSHCFHKGELLVPGMEVFSLLLTDQAEQIARRDYCTSCWKCGPSLSGDNSAVRGYWKSTIERKKSVEQPSRIGRALTLLQELRKAPEGREEEI